MLNEQELKMLELIVANKGDVEKAKTDYEAALRSQYASNLIDGHPDVDMLAIIDDTVSRKVKVILPAIGTAFIKQGKALGGKTRISTNNKEN